ncbi:hypothetical protein [Phaffia rhodozyma]|uniref:Uncharacterized protein n=1 Tax=Phaffia rhodozyma TaxID=264483 RepID=A0A0F7SH84_PHARH|nr:hypothetical protein [Phaffia rhodozyma]
MLSLFFFLTLSSTIFFLSLILLIFLLLSLVFFPLESFHISKSSFYLFLSSYVPWEASVSHVPFSQDSSPFKHRSSFSPHLLSSISFSFPSRNVPVPFSFDECLMNRCRRKNLIVGPRDQLFSPSSLLK